MKNFGNYFASVGVAVSAGIIVWHSTHGKGFTTAAVVFSFMLCMIFYNKFVHPME